MKTICIYNDFISSFIQTLKLYLINNQTLIKMKKPLIISSIYFIVTFFSCQKADVKPQVLVIRSSH
jgi:hypothetical protein